MRVSWHVSNVAGIGWVYFKQQHLEFSWNSNEYQTGHVPGLNEFMEVLHNRACILDWALNVPLVILVLLMYTCGHASLGKFHIMGYNLTDVLQELRHGFARHVYCYPTLMKIVHEYAACAKNQLHIRCKFQLSEKCALFVSITLNFSRPNEILGTIAIHNDPRNWKTFFIAIDISEFKSQYLVTNVANVIMVYFSITQ